MLTIKSLFKFIIIVTSIIIYTQTLLARTTTIDRTITALWDSRSYTDAQDYTSSRIHKTLEMPLNHLGYKVLYIDIKNGIDKKSQEKINKSFAIITWFIAPLKDPVAIYTMLNKRLKQNIKILILGKLGLNDTVKTIAIHPKVKNFFKNFGMKVSTDIFDNQFFNTISNCNLNNKKTATKKIKKPIHDRCLKNKIINYERNFQGEMPAFKKVISINKSNTSLLRVKAINDKDSVSDVIWYGPHGGYAQNNFEIFQDPINFRFQWRINPFIFLKRSLNSKIFPIPDITIKNGKRIFYSHIDGDGINNMSYYERKKSSIEVVREELLQKFNLPISVSFIVAELDPNQYGKKFSLKEAIKISKLKNIEIASHTYTHPLSWSKHPSKSEFFIYNERTKKYKNDPIVAYPFFKHDLRFNTLDYKLEVVGSIKYLNNVLKLSKKTNLIFWSGSCLPPEYAIQEAYKHNILNINGGDGRYDIRYNSITNLAPFYRQVGKYIQVFTSFANENIYTNLWHGPFDGQKLLLQGFKKTLSPILLMPLNIYYHFYSGERASSLQALSEAYKYVLEHNSFPMFTSQFIKNVDGFITTKIQRINETTFQIQDNGNLTTFRIDDTKLIPNYKRSKNIIGHRVINNSTYIFLGKKHQTFLKLTRKKTTSSVYINQSSCDVINFQRFKKEIRIKTHCLAFTKNNTLLLKGFNQTKEYKINSKRISNIKLFKVQLKNGNDTIIIKYKNL